jgi:hypothetical protein
VTTAAMARGTAVDVASTRTFIAAATRLESSAVNMHKAEETSANALIRHISSTCQSSLSSSTRSGSAAQQATWGAFTSAAGYELVLAELKPLRPAYARLIGDLKPLRWTNSTLNRLVGANASRSQQELNLRPPDLCSQTRAAARSHFSVIPSTTLRFLRSARIALPAAGTQPTFSGLVGKMKPYTTPGEATAITRLRGLEHRYGQLNSAFGPGAYLRIMKALSGV